MRFLFSVLALTITLGTFAQEEMIKPKVLGFGFDFGINRSNLSFGSEPLNGQTLTNDLGYRLGLVSELRMGRKFALLPKAELSFNAGRLESNNESFKVSPVNLELIGHLKYNFLRTPFSPYIIAGANWRLPIVNGSSDDRIPTENNVALDAGIGLTVPIAGIRVSPELRYSFGLNDITSHLPEDIRHNNIAIVLIFSK
jgi:hypothetical protein